MRSTGESHIITTTMQSRRTFFQMALGALWTPKFLSGSIAGPGAQSKVKHYKTDKPLSTLQQEFIDLRFGMFLHFNMATYQDREWGDPTGPTEAFEPTKLDTDQWAEAAKTAGMTYGCLTTKHHDGFCLWPTKTKSDSILKTPSMTDIVKSYSDSFRKAGLKVGLYYSILSLRDDIRHHNITPEKIQLIKDQLRELLTEYGDIAFLIFDGWDAPWSRIPYSEVPFDEIYALIKELQPNCLVAELNASEYPSSGLYYTDIKSFEQNAGQEVPEGSSLPAVSCVTLSDGWFWKQSDDNANLKSANQVVNEWLIPLNKRSCNLICNAAPNRSGRLSDNLVARLKEIGQLWKHSGPMGKLSSHSVITTLNLATGLTIHASSYPDTVGPDQANDGKFESAWYPVNSDRKAWLELSSPEEITFNTFVVVEPIGKYHDYITSRIEQYAVEIYDNGSWKTLLRGDLTGSVKIHEFPQVSTKKVRFAFDNKDGGNTAHIAEVGLYLEPVRRSIP